MIIFGLGYDGFHDSNISVLKDTGEILLSINEERLSGVKKDGRFPFKSIKIANPTFKEILCVSNLKDKEFFESYNRAGLEPDKQTLKERKKIFENINKFKKKFRKVYFFSHHDCHAASAYYYSGFKKSLVITWDAGNNSEPWNMTVHSGKGCNLERMEEFLDGLPALDYAAITALLGFMPARHEGKITGLSAAGFASKKEIEKVDKILKQIKGYNSLMARISFWKNIGSNNKNPKIILKKKEIEKIKKEFTGISIENMANAIQIITERKVLDKIKKLKKKYKEENICLAGGIFANILINKKIKELGFKNIFIHPAMGDDGLSLGACAKYLGNNGMKPKRLENIFFGPSFTEKYIEKCLKKSGLKFFKPKNIEKIVANKLDNGKIIARFFGRMEYGPRALGNRSILCSAENKDINDILNEKLKRSEFMPFAPITLEKDADYMYKNISGSIYASKFMTIGVDCKKKMKEQNPAVIHIDGTARPQIVGYENKGLMKILKEYKKISGNFSLINTSFNMHESPIVYYPKQAILAFKQSKLDYLILGNFLAEKK